MHYKHCEAKIEELDALLKYERRKVDANLKGSKYVKVAAIGFALIGGLTMSLGVAVLPLVSLIGGCLVLLFMECKRYVEKAYRKISVIEGAAEYLTTFKKDTQHMADMGELNTIDSVLEVVATLDAVQVSIKSKMLSL